MGMISHGRIDIGETCGIVQNGHGVLVVYLCWVIMKDISEEHWWHYSICHICGCACDVFIP